MISCTEFILAYSELFRYLDVKYGREEVNRLWDFLFKPTGKGIPLINYAKKDGLKGCIDQWTGTLTEESAEVTFIYNLEDGWFASQMHHCPSKGRLLEFKDTLGIEPYYDYCDHCDYYRASLEEVGLTWIRNHVSVDKANCSRIIWDPKVFKGVMKMNENTVIKEFHASEHEYYHPDFHSSMNMGIEYLGLYHGKEDIKAYLTMFTRDAYGLLIKEMQSDPLKALANKICQTYIAEKAEDALELSRTEHTLSVDIKYCPAVRHLKKTGRQVSEWFSYTTEVVMGTLAESAGIQFKMNFYDANTGAASYAFTK